MTLPPFQAVLDEQRTSESGLRGDPFVEPDVEGVVVATGQSQQRGGGALGEVVAAVWNCRRLGTVETK